MCTEEWPNLQNIKIINIITIYKYVVEMYIKIITYTAGSAKFKWQNKFWTAVESFRQSNLLYWQRVDTCHPSKSWKIVGSGKIVVAGRLLKNL